MDRIEVDRTGVYLDSVWHRSVASRVYWRRIGGHMRGSTEVGLTAKEILMSGIPQTEEFEKEGFAHGPRTEQGTGSKILTLDAEGVSEKADRGTDCVLAVRDAGMAQRTPSFGR